MAETGEREALIARYLAAYRAANGRELLGRLVYRGGWYKQVDVFGGFTVRKAKLIDLTERLEFRARSLSVGEQE